MPFIGSGPSLARSMKEPISRAEITGCAAGLEAPSLGLPGMNGDVALSTSSANFRWLASSLENRSVRYTQTNASPGSASDHGEPFGEPTWTGFRRQSPTPGHYLGCSSAQ